MIDDEPLPGEQTKGAEKLKFTRGHEDEHFEGRCPMCGSRCACPQRLPLSTERIKYLASLTNGRETMTDDELDAVLDFLVTLAGDTE